MKIAIVDTYYPDFLRTLPKPQSYQQGLADTLGRFFGTHSAYSRALQNIGWETRDILANYGELQRLWDTYDSDTLPAIALNQIEEFEPDVIFLQDLGFFDQDRLEYLSDAAVLAGQCSCRFEDEAKLRQFDVIFTSFPFYVDRFNALGVQGVFLPLAFDPIVIEQVEIPLRRTHAVTFIGGYGRHWDMDDLFLTLAAETPIEFWGYGFETAPAAIQTKWHGPVWGLDMYKVLLGSHIVVNRHGGIAQGYSNNLRMFEATGCGALLLTEQAPNLADYFNADQCATYLSPADAVARIDYYLSNSFHLAAVAGLGQSKTLRVHTYAQRMPVVSKILEEHVRKRAA